MCGIAGVAFRDPVRFPDRDLLQGMTETMVHRGPDGEGYHLDAGIGLGIRRLSIIDLETGDQPVCNEDRSVAVVCNGEIYNYVELHHDLQAAGHHLATRSDSETIAHLYEAHGSDCVHKLRGMFAFALWDERHRRLLLARDRLGIKSLVYCETNGGVCFGSQQKALLALDAVPRAVNPCAVKDVMSFGFVVGPKTMFAAIRQLPPGGRLVYQGGKLSVERYWDLPAPSVDRADRRRRAGQWAELLLDRLDETVRVHLRGDAPVGAWLSGGVDSSAVVALMHRHMHEPIPVTALSFDVPGLDELRTQRTLLDCPEYGLRGRVALCGVDALRRLPEALWICEGATSSGLEIVRLLLAEHVAQDAKVVLCGEGADEVFCGYPWFRKEKVLQMLRPLPTGLRRMLAAVPVHRGHYLSLRKLLVDDRPMSMARYRDSVASSSDPGETSALSTGLRDELGELPDHPDELALPAGFASWDRLNQLQYYELRVRLPYFVLSLVGSVVAARGVEARVPFLDHELVALAARIPPGLKAGVAQEKRILRKAVRPVLPREIAGRPKRGLRAPADAWMRAPLPEFAETLLSATAITRKGYFDPVVVARMLAEHQAHEREWGHRLMGVLAVQLWDHLFRQGEGPPAG